VAGRLALGPCAVGYRFVMHDAQAPDVRTGSDGNRFDQRACFQRISIPTLRALSRVASRAIPFCVSATPNVDRAVARQAGRDIQVDLKSEVEGGGGPRLDGGRAFQEAKPRCFCGHLIITWWQRHRPIIAFRRHAQGGIGDDAGHSGGIGILASGGTGNNGATNGLAGKFTGDVQIDGALNVTGTKNFKIDHPLDPENKYLYHAAIESSEVLNIYSGNIATDAKGEAVVKMRVVRGAE
jgi:hypothetical protein